MLPVTGRNDAWKSFGRGSLWSQKGDKWKFNKACESFGLLNVFYPDNIRGWLRAGRLVYFHPLRYG